MPPIIQQAHNPIPAKDRSWFMTGDSVPSPNRLLTRAALIRAATVRSCEEFRTTRIVLANAKHAKKTKGTKPSGQRTKVLGSPLAAGAVCYGQKECRWKPKTSA